MKLFRISLRLSRLFRFSLGWVMCFGTCGAQEITASFPETRPGLVMEFDSPKDLDPLFPGVQVNESLPDRLMLSWLNAFKRDEQDLKRLVAESISAAHRGGDNAAETILPLLDEFSRSGSNRLTHEAVAAALVELDAKEAANAFYENVDQASWTLSEIIEPALANWQDRRMEEAWLERLQLAYPDKARQRLAIDCLRTLGSQKAIAGLSELARSKFASASLRITAAEALGNFDRSANVVLAEELVSNQRGSRVDRLVAAKLLRKQSDESAGNILIDLTKDEESSVVSVAAQHLFETNPQLVKPLAKELAESANANVRMLAAKAFTHASSEADIEKLIEMLADHHPPLRQQVREMLESKAKNGEFVELIDAALIGIVRDAHSNADWRQLEQAIIYLGELDKKRAAAFLVRHLHSSRRQVFLPAAWALRKLSVEETFDDCLDFINQAVAQLGSQLADRYLEAQLSQLCQMYGINHYEPAVEVLSTFIPKRVRSRGAQARAAAVWSLGHIYKDRLQPALAASLVERLNDDNPNDPEAYEVRAASAVAIARMGHAERAPVLKHWLNTESPKTLLGYSCAWGVQLLTGDAIPEIEPKQTTKLGWFLFPIPILSSQ